MQWDAFVDSLSHTDRARLIRALDEARLYGGLPARATDQTDVEWIVSCIDRALDALAAARILLGAPIEPQPWANDAYRAYRSAAHLWAAAVYGVVQGRPDLHPLTVSHLPSFLAYAEEIARLATTLAWAEPEEELSLNRNILWTFVLPEGVARKAEALPLSQPNVSGAIAPTSPAPRVPR